MNHQKHCFDSFRNETYQNVFQFVCMLFIKRNELSKTLFWFVCNFLSKKQKFLILINDETLKKTFKEDKRQNKGWI